MSMNTTREQVVDYSLVKSFTSIKPSSIIIHTCNLLMTFIVHLTTYHMPYRDMLHGTQHTAMAAEKEVVFA